MQAKTIMVQGTASSAGKSILVAALCRILRQDGYRVAPFKAQNMALNSFVTIDGGEIGRAQAVQAEAAGAEMSVDMNPILLKPEADARCQVVVLGRPFATLSAAKYYEYKNTLWPIVIESLERLRNGYDVVVIEGAGSPAEVNLKDGDIVNMRVALAAEAPVLLVGDIDRGGVLASVVGTLELLEPNERAAVKGLVINKFRGDLSLLKPGLDFLETRTGVPVVGVIPFIRDMRIADEDSVCLEDKTWRGAEQGLLDIVVVHLPHMSNFDDFDPLRHEPQVKLRLVDKAGEIGRPDLIILPGTKTTIADLEHLRTSGIAAAIAALAGECVPIIGICGGYQMLGRRLYDPHGVESAVAEAEGLGLLPVSTIFEPGKNTCRVKGHVVAGEGVLSLANGVEVEGYEIHTGRTEADGPPTIHITSRSGREADSLDGAIAQGGRVFGTYLHGLWDRPEFRQALLRWLANQKNISLEPSPQGMDRDREYDRLAAVVRDSLNMRLIYRLIGVEGRE